MGVVWGRDYTSLGGAQLSVLRVCLKWNTKLVHSNCENVRMNSADAGGGNSNHYGGVAAHVSVRDELGVS